MEENAMNDFQLILIGGSAGSLEVLVKLLPKFPADARFSMVIILHRKSGEDTTLEELLSVKAALPVVEIEDKTPLLQGRIYVAPSDYHLLFEKNKVLSLDTSEKVNYSRPSIDVSFESAADAFGKSVTAILLSGANNDGTAGLNAVKAAGGITVVQRPETAEMPFMPQYAIDFASPDQILDPEEIGILINSFA